MILKKKWYSIFNIQWYLMKNNKDDSRNIWKIASLGIPNFAKKLSSLYLFNKESKYLTVDSFSFSIQYKASDYYYMILYEIFRLINTF